LFKKSIKNETVVSIFDAPDLPMKDFDKLALELEVESLAKRAGRDNLPNENSTSEDATEIKFRESFQNDLIKAHNKINQSNSKLMTSIDDIRLEKELSEMKDLPSVFESQLTNELDSEIKELERLAAHKRVVEDDLLRFKKENELKRSAQYPLSGALTVSLLLLAIIIESAMNGVFFANGNDLGLIGGISIALGISLLNVIPSFFLGKIAYTQIFHINRLRIFFGILGTVFAGVSAFLLNFMVAHYREALIHSPDEASTVAVESLKNSIVGINDAESWLLCILGIVFFVFAFYKGIKSDDIYPGFGRKDRNLRDAETDLSHHLEDVTAELADFTDEFQKKVVDIHEHSVYLIRKFDAAVATIDNQNKLFASYVKHIDGAYSYITRLYRDANSAARSNNPPVYFNSSEKLKYEFEFTPLNSHEKRHELNEQLKFSESQLPTLKKELLELSNQYSSKLHEVASR
jgi:hypothetical protein